jgi:transposase
VPTHPNTVYVGLDVHKASIHVAVIPAGARRVTEHWELANQKRAIARLVKKLKGYGAARVVSCYEAGPCGYVLQRQLLSEGISCQVIAPSLIPVRPGERVKTDSRDARKLAEHLRAGLLTEVHPPTPEEEAVRDLVRAREDARHDLTRARHRLSKFLLRQGQSYDQGRNWTKKHHQWLRRLRLEYPTGQTVLATYILSMDQLEERLAQLDRDLEEVASSDRYREPVGWLRCIRGIDTLTAITIIAEVHDFRRFDSPRRLMAYLGLTPREFSSGDQTRRGAITKAGNMHARRVLVEAAWAYRHRAKVSVELRKRREGQPPGVIALADRMQQRLHRKYWRMKEGHKKPHNVVTVALAREMVGYIWAVMNERW